MKFPDPNIMRALCMVLGVLLVTSTARAEEVAQRALIAKARVTSSVTMRRREPASVRDFAVQLRSLPTKGNFIFRSPGGRYYVAELHRVRSRKSADINAVEPAIVHTFSGKLFRSVRSRKVGSYRAAHRRRAGTFTISRIENSSTFSVHGIFKTPDGAHYTLSSPAGRAVVLSVVDPHLQPGCGDTVANSFLLSGDPVPDSVTSPLSTPTTQSTAEIKVLFVYSPSALAAVGSEANMQTLIATMVSYANTAFSNSAVDAQYSVAASALLPSPDEDPDFVKNLLQLAASDGVWDSVHQLRAEYGADMVTMIVENLTYCGLAFVGGGSSYAFSVVNVSCISSLAHELGHNLGADHDVDNTSTGPVDGFYNYGWRFTGDSTGEFRTVMAYEPGDRIPYFSSPLISYDGQPTGVANSADNARVLRAAAPLVAAYSDDVAKRLTFSITQKWSRGARLQFQLRIAGRASANQRIIVQRKLGRTHFRRIATYRTNRSGKGLLVANLLRTPQRLRVVLAGDTTVISRQILLPARR